VNRDGLRINPSFCVRWPGTHLIFPRIGTPRTAFVSMIERDAVLGVLVFRKLRRALRRLLSSN
jgi:hypothetical protein